MNYNNKDIVAVHHHVNPNQYAKSKKLNPTKPFESFLTEAIDQKGNVKFSRHAFQRLEKREIELTENQLIRLNEGIEKASQKGIRDSLVLLDDVALVVNVKSKTVITAMDKQENKIFTNIDGTVIL